MVLVYSDNIFYANFYGSLLDILSVDNMKCSSVQDLIKIINMKVANFNLLLLIIVNKESFKSLNECYDTLDKIQEKVIIVKNDGLRQQASQFSTKIYDHSFNLTSFVDILSVMNLTKSYRSKNIVEDIGLKLKSGDIVLPVNNEAATKAMSMLDADNLNIRDFSNIIKLDTSMHAAIMKMANSVYYSGSASSVTFLDKALIRLGLNAVKIFLIYYINKALAKNSKLIFHENILNECEKSLQVASYCYVIAEKIGYRERDAVFSIGMLCNIGKIFLYSIFSEYLELNKVQNIDYQYYIDTVESKYVNAGLSLLSVWNFTDIYKIPIKFQDDGVKNSFYKETCILICAKSQVYENKIDFLPLILDELNLNFQDLKEIQEKGIEHYALMKQILS